MSTKTEKIRKVLGELTIITVSILLAFAIDAWWDGVKNDRRERADLERLEAEFAEMDSVMVIWQKGQERIVEVSERLLEMTGRDGGQTVSDDSLAMYIGTIATSWSLDPPLATFTSLEASGRLSTLSNQRLVTALAKWRADLVDLQSDEEVVQSRVEAELRPFLSSMLSLRKLEISKGRIPAGPHTGFDSGHQSLFTSRAFENLLVDRLLSAREVSGNYAQVRSQLATVRQIIARELAR